MNVCTKKHWLSKGLWPEDRLAWYPVYLPLGRSCKKCTGRGRGKGRGRALLLHRSLDWEGGWLYRASLPGSLLCLGQPLSATGVSPSWKCDPGTVMEAPRDLRCLDSSGLCLRATLRGPRGMISPLGTHLAIQFLGTYKSFLCPVKSSPYKLFIQ